MTKTYKRWQQKVLAEAMETRRVLLLSGPRQCGKTTLCQTIASKDVIYRTLDDVALLLAARNNPSGFIEHTAQMMIIDEVQHEPNLLLAIKQAVDKDTRPGQYLLTGSANIQSLPNVKESLAGRMRRLRLRGLAQGEIENSLPYFLERAFIGNFKNESFPCTQQNIIHRALKGGFPEAFHASNRNRKLWYADYVGLLIERDLKEIANIKRQDAMQQLVRIMAAWSSKYMDLSAIGSSLAIQRPTLESYINALEALYLVEKVPPWTKTDYDRVGKKDKLFMTDCGLMASLLGWKEDTLPFEVDRLGKLFETFIFNELMVQIDAAQGLYDIFQYRDKDKREIDFIIEREDGALLGIEVKSGSAIDNKSLKHLKWFKNNLCKNKEFKGIILYAGEHVISFGDNIWGLPISFLWNTKNPKI